MNNNPNKEDIHIKLALIFTPSGVESVSILSSKSKDRELSSRFLSQIIDLVSDFEKSLKYYNSGVQ